MHIHVHNPRGPHPTARTLRSNEHWRDPLGRKPGESIDPLRYSEADLAKIKKNRGPRAWSCIYMQDPRVMVGNLIDRNEHFLSRDPNKRRVLSPAAFEQATKGLTWGRGWDFAYTAQQYNKPDPDYTVGVKMAFKIDDDTETFDIYVEDIVRFRENWGDNKRNIRDTALRDGPACFIGGEGNGPQSVALQDIRGLPSLAQYRVVGAPLAADKSGRAQLWASRVQERRMWLKEATWNNLFFDEAEAFPNGAKDDIVDAMSVAYILSALIADGLGGDGDAQLAELDINSRW